MENKEATHISDPDGVEVQKLTIDEFVSRTRNAINLLCEAYEKCVDYHKDANDVFTDNESFGRNVEDIVFCTPQNEIFGLLDCEIIDTFTPEQENAIWGVIQHLSKEQHKDPKKVITRAEVFKLINDELNF